MRRGAAALTALLALPAFGQQQDAVLDTMKAELKRSMALQLNNLDKPYYIAYTLDDEHSWSASASLGGLLSAGANAFRLPGVRLRVGDYKFDNTNWTGAGAAGPRYDLHSFPLEDDADVMRQYFWLTTDSAYKGALRSLAGKNSALRNVTVTEQLPDFANVTPFTLFKDYSTPNFDLDRWKETTRRVSGVFDKYRSLRTSSVQFTAIDALHRFVTSEGTSIRVPDSAASVEIRASAQAADGMILRDIAVFYSRDVMGMFPEAELTRTADELGANLLKLAAAPVSDNYTGPVLFEGVAGPQLMAQLLGRNLHISRKPVALPGSPAQNAQTELEGRRGVRILPEFFKVTDDPSLPLFGHEEADDEGVPDQKVTLVEKGVLRDFLRTRQPVRGYAASNGHARMNGAFGAAAAVPTNLIIEAAETASIADMKKQLIDLCQQRGLEFGLVIRKLDFPSSAGADEARRILASAGGSPVPVSMPLYAYRLYADGHEELVRGLRFKGINARSLKDILAAGNDQITFNYLENGQPYALLGFGASSAQVAISGQSLLVDDLELTKSDDELPKLPLVGSPLLSSLNDAASSPAR